MRKAVSLLFVVLIGIGNLFSQNISDLLTDIPDGIIPGLTEETKSAFFDNTAPTTMTSLFGTLERLVYSDDYLKIKTSEKGTIQIKLLEQNHDEPIICVVKTVCAPACDSNIQFYSSVWELLDKETYFPKIEGSQMIATTNPEKQINNYSWLLPDIYFITAEFTANHDDLLLKLNLENYLSSERLAEMKQVFGNDELLLKWKNNKFE